MWAIVLAKAISGRPACILQFLFFERVIITSYERGRQCVQSRLSVWLSVCPVRFLTSESLETLSLVCRYHFQISSICRISSILGGWFMRQAPYLNTTERPSQKITPLQLSLIFQQCMLIFGWNFTHLLDNKLQGVPKKSDCFLTVCNFCTCLHRIAFYISNYAVFYPE